MNPITKLRKDNGYSQAQLAVILGVSQSAVSQWEVGRTLPDILTAQKLALIFGVAIEDLIEASDYDSLLPATKMRHSFSGLNEIGQKKALEYIEDLHCIEKYRKKPGASGDTDNGDS